jgi:ribosomal protein S18 acetylase RimI-like enzyme
MPASPGGPDPDELVFRRPVEGDHATVVAIVEHWWGEKRARALATRSWFRHFTGTSWVVEDTEGRLLGFLIGYRSPDDPARAVIHLIGVHPSHRRRGLGRALADRFLGDARAAGVRRVEAVTPPDRRAAIAFHRAMGFRPDDGPGTMRLYGTPATPDLEGEGEDRVLLVRDL